MTYRTPRCHHGIQLGFCEEPSCPGYRGRKSRKNLENRSGKIKDDLHTCNYCKRRVNKSNIGPSGICVGGCAERSVWGPNEKEAL